MIGKWYPRTLLIMTGCKRCLVTSADENIRNRPGGFLSELHGNGVGSVMFAVVVLLFLIGLSACTSHSVAPVGRNPYSELDYHTVRKGENVYAIAHRYGLDYHQLAMWNRIRPPLFRIHPGQKIRLFAYARKTRRSGSARDKRSMAREIPRSKASVPGKPPPPPKISKVSRPPKTTWTPKKPTNNTRTSSNARISTNTKVKSPIRPPITPKKKNATITKWYWPSKGKLVRNFSQSGNRGLDIQGKFESPIYAVADGKVVYTGSGLRGYGKLIIIKHNRHYLSAYANNNRMLVKEGTDVSGGQKIAEMGRSGSHLAMLHFEIRKNGKPVNPIRYLKTR